MSHEIEHDYEYAADDNPNRNAPMNIVKRSNDVVIRDDEAQLVIDAYCRGATPAEASFFIADCNARRLDPRKRQIFFVKRWDSNLRREVAAHQVSIDGMRAIAADTGLTDGHDGPYWCGKDGKWADVWLSSDPPTAAKYTVFRKGAAHGFTAVARFDAYVQTTKEGKPTRFWRTMGDNQLAKCAEALATRKAFPEPMSGVYTTDEMDHAYNDASNGNNGHLPKGQSQPTTPDALLAELTAPPAIDEPPTIDADADINEESFVSACGNRDYSRKAAKAVLARLLNKPEFKQMWTENPRAAYQRITEQADAGIYDAYLSEIDNKIVAA
jgi:phage recombination protein Bet